MDSASQALLMVPLLDLRTPDGGDAESLIVSEQSTYSMRTPFINMCSFNKYLLRAKYCVRRWGFKLQPLPLNCSQSAQKQASKQITRMWQRLTPDRWRALGGGGAADKISQRQLCFHGNLERQVLPDRSGAQQCAPGDKGCALDHSLGRLL